MASTSTSTSASFPSWAPLTIIKAWKLLADQPDATEVDKLLDAVESLGFFHLDLWPPADTTAVPSRFQHVSSILALADELFGVMKELFKLEQSIKSLYDVSTNQSYFGCSYKGVGRSYIDKAGTLDCNEFYNISKDDILQQNDIKLAHPPIIENNRSTLKTFVEASSTIVTVLLQSFASRLQLHGAGDESEPQSEDALNARHRPSAASGDQISFIKYPPSPSPARSSQPIASHTDYGSITILFTSQKGLQVQVPAPNGAAAPAEWRFVEPLPGHAIVNCGDALNIFTAGRIRSNLHRVASQADRQSVEPKYSLGYFCRPEHAVRLEPLVRGEELRGGGGCCAPEGTGLTSKEWVMKRTYTRLVENYRGQDAWEETLGTDRARLEGA